MPGAWAQENCSATVGLGGTVLLTKVSGAGTWTQLECKRGPLGGRVARQGALAVNNSPLTRGG